MLHLHARLKMVASGPVLRRGPELIFTDQPGQALVGNFDIITSRQLLLNPNDVALTVEEELAYLSDVLVISRLLAD